MNHPEFIDVGKLPDVVTDLRYATDNNFMGKNIYGVFRDPYLHREAAEKFIEAVRALKEGGSGYRFLILDALRPRRAQQVLWDFVEGTPEQEYVANPVKGSIHNFGFALDITLVDREGRELDMGTPFDSFSPVAQPKNEPEMFVKGLLTREQLDNREILKNALESAGFSQLSIEWWHFDADKGDNVRGSYQIVE